MNIVVILLIIIFIVIIMRNNQGMYVDESDLLTHYLSYPYSSYGRHSKGRKEITKNTLERYLRVNGKCSNCRGNGKMLK